MNYSQARLCETHSSQYISFLCTHKSCYQSLCSECLFSHCKDHEKNKTFPEIKSLDILRQELSQNLGDFLRTLYQELDDMTLSSSDKIIKTLDQAEDEVTEIVRLFFKEQRKKALYELQHVAQTDTAASQLKERLQSKILSYEDLNVEINSSATGIDGLQAVSKRDFSAELQEILDEISAQLNPVKLWRSENLENSLKKCLESAFCITKGAAQLIFPPDKRDSDIEVKPGDQTVVTKKGDKGTASICLGPCLNKGTHSFSVRIDVLAGNNMGGFMGWVAMGFIENDTINLSQNNYSSAICICTDQSFYKVHVTQTEQVTIGGTYHFEVNFESGEVKITGDNGLEAKAEGYQGKSLFPYIEMTHKHQLTIFNYKKSK